MEAGEPDPAQVDKFYGEIHAIIRAGLIDKNRDDFIDALQAIMEYGPTDPPTSKNVARVEERMFLNLGPRAKLVAVRALARLGEIPALRQAVLAWPRRGQGGPAAPAGGDHGRSAPPDFYPYLKHELAQCKTGKVESERREKSSSRRSGASATPRRSTC